MDENTNPDEAQRLAAGVFPQSVGDGDLSWLSGADKEAARHAEQVDRLAGDRELVDTLRQSDFAGKHYRLFANELAKYGLAVIRGWIVRDLILGKVAERGFGRLAPPPIKQSLLEDADGLADETVTRALHAFREKVLLPGVWDPRKGASLRTFFIGQCLMQFSNVYRSWLADQLKHFAEYSGFADLEKGPALPTVPPPGTTAEKRDEIRWLFGHISDDRVKSAFYLHAIHGHTYSQIAIKLDMSEKAIESAIARARKILKNGRDTA
jgi:DNA-directed RNA polymerase specialized sigma24 family protein